MEGIGQCCILVLSNYNPSFWMFPPSFFIQLDKKIFFFFFLSIFMNDLIQFCVDVEWPAFLKQSILIYSLRHIPIRSHSLFSSSFRSRFFLLPSFYCLHFWSSFDHLSHASMNVHDFTSRQLANHSSLGVTNCRTCASSHLPIVYCEHKDLREEHEDLLCFQYLKRRKRNRNTII